MTFTFFQELEKLRTDALLMCSGCFLDFKTVVLCFIYDNSFDIDLLPSEREGCTGKYWPEVVIVRTERSEVCSQTNARANISQ